RSMPSHTSAPQPSPRTCRLLPTPRDRPTPRDQRPHRSGYDHRSRGSVREIPTMDCGPSGPAGIVAPPVRLGIVAPPVRLARGDPAAELRPLIRAGVLGSG